MKHLAFEISDLSLIRVAGVDAIKVLNGLCTAKLVELPAGGAAEAMFTDDRGRVLAHGMVVVEPDQPAAWIIGQFPEPAKLTAHIDRFIFREEAQPKNATGMWNGLLIDNNSTGSSWSALANELSIPADAGCARVLIDDHACWLMRLPITSADSRLLLMPQAAMTSLASWLERFGIAMGLAEDLEDRRIGNFWPLACDMNERTLPQELDRDQRAISFTKGCYLGQETVARLDSLGEVQKKLCLVQLDGFTEMASGQALMKDDKEVGKLSSISPVQHAGKRLALATMRRGSTSPGSEFSIASRDDATTAATTMGAGAVIAHP